MRVISFILMLVVSSFAVLGGEDILTPAQRMQNKENEVFFKNCDLIMDHFNLKSLRLVPCGDKETVRFFKDIGEINGKTYILEGAELLGPFGVGVRCAYAKATDLAGNPCPRDIEVALHVLGKFRYCLWGGEWMCRKTYEGECIKNEDGTFDAPWGWNKGSTVEKVDLPLPENVRMEKVTSAVGVPFFTVSWFTKKTIKSRVPKVIMRDQLIATSQDCSSCEKTIGKDLLTEASLKERGLIGSNETLAKILFAEERTDTTVTLMEASPVVVMVDTIEERCFVRTTIYPIDN